MEKKCIATNMETSLMTLSTNLFGIMSAHIVQKYVKYIGIGGCL